MRAWSVQTPGPMSTHPLVSVDLPRPEPAPGEVLLRVSVCGVCRTDLHLAEGDLSPHRPHTVPGHEVVGTVEELGADSRRFRVGQRVGIAWLGATCGVCHWCRRGAENLCVTPHFTGWDADGGFAEYAVVDEAFAYELPDSFDDEHAAPLLCAGIIGYRSLKRAALPPGGRLAIYGFGASAHLAAQVALAQGATVHVLTRARSPRAISPCRSGPTRSARATGYRRSPSTRPSSSRLSENWCRLRCQVWNGAERSRSPASI